MTRSNPEDESTRAVVKHFCHLVLRLTELRFTFRELFHDDAARSLMERTAQTFFLELNKILQEYFLLEVAKLTDPATSGRGRSENLTVANIIDSVLWPPNYLHEIKKLNETVLSFREYIKPARDRLLAHYDKATILSGASLGGFPEGEDKKLLDVLQQMCNVLHEAAFGKIFGEMGPSGPGDVLDLKKALTRAIAFDKLFAESRGDDLIRLCRLLEDVDGHATKP